MIISDVSVKRPVFATVISLMLVVFGVLAFGDLPVRELPDVDAPVVSIRTNYPGANAEVVENRITRVIEDRISGVDGIKSISSNSSDGRSSIDIEFELDRNIDSAANDVRDRVARVVGNLPDQVRTPEVTKADDDARPVIWFNLIHPDMDVMQLTDYAERNFVDRLSVIDGVARVRVGGGSRYSMRIDLNREAMAARLITVEDVEQALRRENVEFPAGRLESVSRDTIVRLNREYESPEDFQRLKIKDNDGSDKSGNIVRLGDIAKVYLGRERAKRMFRGNGKTMVSVGVEKQSQANTLQVAKEAKDLVKKMSADLPEGMTFDASYDSSLYIEEAIDEVYRTLAIAMGLVVLVLFLFLGNIKTVLVPAVTVPVCLTATFWILSLTGVSINLITLLGIVLAIGLVVDDAIVVLENIYRRVDEGEPGLMAAYKGARQVGFAVIATTLVLIGVFVPIMFLTGNIGRLFGELAITMSAAVAFSSLIALTLSPMMCSKLVRRKNVKPKFAVWLDKQFKKLQAAYAAFLNGALDHKMLVSLIFLLCGMAVYGLMSKVPSELTPQEDRSTMFLRIRGPEGASFDYMTQQAKLVEAQILPLLETGELKRLLLNTRTGSGWGFVILTPVEARTRSTAEIATELRRKLITNVPGVLAIPIARSGLSRRGGGGSESLQFVIGGNSYEDIARFKSVLLEELKTYPGIQNADADYRETQPQFKVRIDKERAADLGVSISSIGRTLETMMGGRRVTTFLDGGEEYDVVLQASELDRRVPLDMENNYVRSRTSGALIPLTNLVTVTEESGAGRLRRYNRVRALTISGTVAPGYTLGEVLAHMEGLVREVLPDATSTDYKGATREFIEAGNEIYFTFIMALIVVFLVLAAQFESFVHPFVIMLTVPTAVMGGLLGLYLTGGTLNIYSQVGMIMLIGLAAKNGILIVEFANQLRDQGKSVRESLIEAAELRLRPILMTAISTIMGAVPLLIASGAGAASRQTIGVVVFGGVSIATLLTLIIVPVFYDMIAGFTQSPEHVARELEELEEKQKKGIPAE
ncbi:efflux RND transporter permease subunit [Temperatibacter marinus]|uniref:Efflux RND transporter permease subunit n=1 Tax=Temperatibacter marinus TaxID=1456591 RepID=A0AA52ED28_9PROT|nr:efflux RND transporter permease subunit [Temperatibacter marinus]WND02536.1 efflux RND transporter permease subunit [Temperatibacter marinus]